MRLDTVPRGGEGNLEPARAGKDVLKLPLLLRRIFSRLRLIRKGVLSKLEELFGGDELRTCCPMMTGRCGTYVLTYVWQ